LIMNTERKNIGWGFWLAWVLISILGFSFGALLGANVAYGLFDREAFDATMGVTLGLVLGATCGFMQWVVLRERIAETGWWVLASALGFAAFFATPGAVGFKENPAIAGILGVIVLGLVGGTLQWLILRRHVERAGWWLVATMFGALIGEIGFPVSIAIGATGNYGLSVIVLGLIFGAGYGAITGGALVGLLSQAESSNVEEMATTH
jgi:hypothetical protein